MIKLTKKRQMVLNIIKNAEKPLCAEDIYSILNNESINLSTIYRSLELFYTERLILKTVYDNKSYYHMNNFKHSHYMVCEKCGTMIPFDCMVHNLENHVLNQYGFKVSHHDLTFYGLCEKCRN